MPLYSINDPKHWLDRAKEARALAEQIDDPEAKRTILKNADDYERRCGKSGIQSQESPSYAIMRRVACQNANSATAITTNPSTKSCRSHVAVGDRDEFLRADAPS
jgi:hypothetical protein